MNIFLLEDDETRIRRFKTAAANFDHTITVAVDFEEAKKLYQSGMYDYLFLDHDLGQKQYVDSSEQNTGAEFCRWLRDNKHSEPFSGTVIHSFNVDGAKIMQLILLDAGWTRSRVVRKPFGDDVIRVLTT